MKRRKPTPLKLAVIAAGIRQVDLAQRMGVSRSRVCHMLSGYKKPTDGQYRILSQLLGQPVADLKAL